MEAATTTTTWPTRPYTPRHASWPYRAADFARLDQSADAAFYAVPRLVTHIDDVAIASLRRYYDAVLPRRGRLLDLCSSWISHYPPAVEEAAAAGDGQLRVVGLGLNAAELAANPVLGGGRIVADLNEQPDVPAALRAAGVAVAVRGDGEAGCESGGEEGDLLDASTMVVSIDYLTDPVAVLRSLRRAMRMQGAVHLAVSNRCFPTKAIARWSRISEEERLCMVGDFLHFAGWGQIEIVELSDGSLGDPLWVVRAVRG